MYYTVSLNKHETPEFAKETQAMAGADRCDASAHGGDSSGAQPPLHFICVQDPGDQR